jgi:predicted nucleic acid-binding protein
MNKVLVDSSVWISFFKGRSETGHLIELLDSNRLCIN